MMLDAYIIESLKEEEARRRAERAPRLEVWQPDSMPLSSDLPVVEDQGPVVIPLYDEDSPASSPFS